MFDAAHAILAILNALLAAAQHSSVTLPPIGC
jgi:hypothetical protein